jgi:hypothetical protein
MKKTYTVWGTVQVSMDIEIDTDDFVDIDETVFDKFWTKLHAEPTRDMDFDLKHWEYEEK